jgi:purine catabolism regulator
MGLSVADAIELPAIAAGQPLVVAGSDGLSAEVRWAHVAEILDVAPLLRGGELILTTGVAWPGARQRLRRHIEQLAEVGVSGIVIELGRRYSEVPAEVIEVGDRAGVPIIALRQETPFVAITEAVHQVVLTTRDEQLAAANAAHEAFTSLSVAGASRQQILDRLMELAHAPVVLESLGHHALAHAAPAGGTSTLLTDWQQRSRLEDRDWLVADVGSRGQQWGRLVLPSPDSERLDQQRMLLERAAEALTIVLLVERDRLNAVQQASRGLLDELNAGRLSEADARARAAALGFSTQGRTFAGVRLVSRAQRAVPPVEQQRRAAQLATALDNACRTCRLPALVTAGESEHATALIALPQRGTQHRELERLAAAVESELASSAWPDPHGVAVGRSVTDLVDARLSLEESERVAEVLSTTPARTDRAYVRIDDLGLAGLLSTVRDEPRWVAFAEAQLAPLLREDASRRTDLEATLLSFIEVGGNKSALARTRNLSRPAIYQRLDRIQQLLQVNLDDASTLSALHVALIVRRLHAA